MSIKRLGVLVLFASGVVLAGFGVWWVVPAKFGMHIASPPPSVAVAEQKPAAPEAERFAAALRKRPKSPPTILVCSPVPDDKHLTDIASGIGWSAQGQLAAIPTLRCEPSQYDALRVQTDRRIQPYMLCDEKEARRAASDIVTDYVWWGRLHKAGSRLIIDGNLAEVRNRGIAKHVRVGGQADDPSALVAALCKGILQAENLHVPSKELTQAAALTVSEPVMVALGRWVRTGKHQKALGWDALHAASANPATQIVSLWAGGPYMRFDHKLPHISRLLKEYPNDLGVLQGLLGICLAEYAEPHADVILQTALHRFPDNYTLMHDYCQQVNVMLDERIAMAERMAKIYPRSVLTWIDAMNVFSNDADELRQARTWAAIPAMERGQVAADYEKIPKFFKKAISIDSSDPGLWERGITVYGLEGSFDEAYNCYRKAIALDPNCAAAYDDMANYCAAKWYAKPSLIPGIVAAAKKAHLDDPEELVGLAQTLLSPEEAGGDYIKDAFHFAKMAASEDHGSFPQARVRYALLLWATGHTQEAKAESYAAIAEAVVPGEPFPLWAGDWAAWDLHLGYYELARILAEADTKYSWLGGTRGGVLGAALIGLNRLQEAQTVLQRYHKDFPKNSDGDLALALLAWKKGDKGGAVHWLHEGRKVDPHCADESWLDTFEWSPEHRAVVAAIAKAAGVKQRAETPGPNSWTTYDASSRLARISHLWPM